MFIYFTVFYDICNTKMFINYSYIIFTMAGDKKKMNYPEVYLIRIDKKLKRGLVKLGSKKVRAHLNKLLKKEKYKND